MCISLRCGTIYMALVLAVGCRPKLDFSKSPNGLFNEYLDERLVPTTPEKARYLRHGMVWNHGPLLDFAYPYGDFRGDECSSPMDTTQYMDGTYRVDDRRGRYTLIQRYEQGRLIDAKLTRVNGAYELYEFGNAYDLSQPFVHYVLMSADGVLVKELCYTHGCTGIARTFNNCDPITIVRNYPRCEE